MNKLEGLYAITPDWPDTQRLLATTKAILAGGCRLLQYRNKAASPTLRRVQASALRELTLRFGAGLIVNDDLALCRDIDADGVHLGQADGELAAARAALPPGRVLGASCYADLTLGHRAASSGADYIAFGSMFPSSSKPLASRADLALIPTAKRELHLPIAAIGGITLDNAAALVDAGADLLAVIGALYNAPDPRRVSQKFCLLFNRSHITQP